ncbi:Piso0_000216 [Millerozyma farinosa CBS 7064]|uniref:Piso0_000216 protein n=1 Tax=Pichia sorbitophila (strain ATCC MYA-4447 / BCRC 22081 / CBS 7064 / NBRC 10061 / NRRL Y-12695) TaxID=559304 RepID=G8YTE1_PICSO|nr:Piso0_000216 [Millerozyma farinosa CBS 7064]
MSHRAKPLSTESLKALPLPRQLDILPPKLLEEFSSSPDLLRGYIKSLPAYQETQKAVSEIRTDQQKAFDSILQILDEYESTGNNIKQKLAELEALYPQFLSLQTTQYQLLAANFSRELLQRKYSALMRQTDAESRSLAHDLSSSGAGSSDYSTSDDGSLAARVAQFTGKRAEYHKRREKLFRWNEDRVAGFI